MNRDQREFLRAWDESLDRLVEKVDRVADAITMSDANAAWETIRSKADTLVQKSGDALTREEAVVRVLKAHPELYDRYHSALVRAGQETQGVRKDDVGQARDLLEWASQRVAADPDSLHELTTDPTMREAVRVVREADERKKAQERQRERERAERDRQVQKASKRLAPSPDPEGADRWPLPRRELIRKRQRQIEVEGEWSDSFSVD